MDYVLVSHFGKWSLGPVCKRWKVWSKWVSVPSHAWSHRFFENASPSFGNLISLDLDTEEMENL